MEPLSGGTRSITLKGSKVPTSPSEVREQASFCGPRVPRSRATTGDVGGPSQEPVPRDTLDHPRNQAGLKRLAGGSLAQPKTPLSFSTNVLPARTSPGARFSLSQQAGQACPPRLAEPAAWRRGASRKPELPATCPARRGGGERQQASLEAGRENS